MLMCTKYDVSVFNPVVGEVCTNDANDNNINNDGQSMIEKGSLVVKPNEPKIVQKESTLTCNGYTSLWQVEVFRLL